MKKFSIIGILLIFFFGFMQAQVLDEGIEMAHTYDIGSARTAAMGNAYTSLGGDLGSVNLNPASLGVMRSGAIQISPGLIISSASNELIPYGNYNNPEMKDTRFKLNVTNFGISGSRKLDGVLKYVNFGATYNRVNDFSYNHTIQGTNDISLLDYFSDPLLTDGIAPDDLDAFTSQMAFNGWLIDTIDNYPEPWEYYNLVNSSIEQRRTVEQRGQINDWDLAMGFNFTHSFYMGFSVGISNLEYDYSYSHKESFTDIYDEYISFEYINDLNIDGRGYDFNIGVIYRPVPFLRIGAAFHTPTYYFIEESYNPILYSGDPRAENPIYPYDYDGQILIGRDDYTMKTPMKINGGLAVQFGKRAIVSADIDYVNYSKMEYRNSPASSDLNLDITNNLDEVINLRFGGEAKFGILALRGGYGYYGSPIEAYDYSRQLFSGGVGFNFGKMYVDLTGMYTMHYSENVVIPLFAGDTYVKTNKTQTIILSTIGFKF